MAGSAFLHADGETLPQGFMRLSEAYRLVHPSEVPAVPAPGLDVDGGNQVSQSEALYGARAVIAAICLESYAAVWIFIAWQYFQIFR